MDASLNVQPYPTTSVEAEKAGNGTTTDSITNEIPSTDSVTGSGVVAAAAPVEETDSIENANKKRPLTTSVEEEGNPAKLQKGENGLKQSDKQTTVTNEGEGETEAVAYAGGSNENLSKLFDSIPSAEGSEEPAEGKQSQSNAAGSSSAVAASVGDQTQNDTSFASASGMVGDESGVTMDDSVGDVGEVLYARNGRPLNRTKRAAQNRAAQRAFRARRDEYVRQTEEKAKLTDDAVDTAKSLKSRLDQSIEFIGKYREQNDELRKLVESLGGTAPAALSIDLTPLYSFTLKQDDKDEKSALDASKDSEDKPERKTAEENASDLASLSAVAVAAAASVSAMEQSTVASTTDDAAKTGTIESEENKAENHLSSFV